MASNDGDAERRIQAKLERLGEDHPHCALCGEDDPRKLQRHHIRKRRYGDEKVIHCLNCHAGASDAQLDHPQPSPRPTNQERIAHLLLGMADYCAALQPTLTRSALELLEDKGDSQS
jgi:hypothetical protein